MSKRIAVVAGAAGAHVHDHSSYLRGTLGSKSAFCRRKRGVRRNAGVVISPK